MRTRSLTVLLAAWTLILAPALCTTGVLAHGCLCEDEVACEHESDCMADPCSDLALRGADGAREANPGSDAEWTAILDDPSERIADRAPRLQPPPRLRGGLPYPPSDLPLLI